MVEIHFGKFNCHGDIKSCVAQGFEVMITQEYLQSHPDNIFVFGDNTLRRGTGGAATLRHMPNTYGFVTKIFARNTDAGFFKPNTYSSVYHFEMKLLKEYIRSHTEHIFLISKLGAGLANRYHIFEEVIQPKIKVDLAEFENVVFLW